MSKHRYCYSAEEQFKIALEAVKGTKTLSHIASETGFHPNQISHWKGQLLDHGASVFQPNGEQQRTQTEANLYEQIGRLKMELEWLKKSLPHSAGTVERAVARTGPHC